MKTIIVPTDYSENAWNATEYAARIAQETDAELILLHVFETPAGIADVLAKVPSMDECTHQHYQRLEEIRRAVVAKYQVRIETAATTGPVMGELKMLYQTMQADLVVMGLRGANPISRLLMGSATAAVLKHAELPVLVVPRDYTFHTLRRILFACDFEPVGESRILQPLKDIAQAFDAMIEVLHLPQKITASPKPDNACGDYWENELGGTKHGYTFLYEDNLQEGIDRSVAESNADLLVMIPRHHNFFEHLLEKTNTQRMVFHARVPLLALPDAVN